MDEAKGSIGNPIEAIALQTRPPRLRPLSEICICFLPFVSILHHARSLGAIFGQERNLFVIIEYLQQQAGMQLHVTPELRRL